MIKPLTSGVEMYRQAGGGPVVRVSPTYGEVAESGPFTASERGMAEQRLRVVGYPRVRFAAAEVEAAAVEVRQAGLEELQRLRASAAQREKSAWAERGVGAILIGLGIGGMIFYVWLAYALIYEGAGDSMTPRRGWMRWRKPPRHGKICFGRQG